MRQVQNSRGRVSTLLSQESAEEDRRLCLSKLVSCHGRVWRGGVCDCEPTVERATGEVFGLRRHIACLSLGDFLIALQLPLPRVEELRRLL